MKRFAIPLAVALLGAPACGPRFETPMPPAPSAGGPGWVSSYTWVDPIGGAPIPEEYVYVDPAGAAYDRRTGHELRVLEHQNHALERELQKEENQAAKEQAKQAAELEHEQEKLQKEQAGAAQPRHPEPAHLK